MADRKYVIKGPVKVAGASHTIDFRLEPGEHTPEVEYLGTALRERRDKAAANGIKEVECLKLAPKAEPGTVLEMPYPVVLKSRMQSAEVARGDVIIIARLDDFERGGTGKNKPQNFEVYVISRAEPKPEPKPETHTS